MCVWGHHSLCERAVPKELSAPKGHSLGSDWPAPPTISHMSQVQSGDHTVSLCFILKIP